MTRTDTLGESVEFCRYDITQGIGIQRDIRHHFHARQQRRLEEAGQLRVELVIQRYRILGMSHDGFMAQVGGQEEHHILAVDQPPFAISQLALVEGLIEQVEYVGMRLFDFVEQYHRVGSLTNRLGQQTTFTEAHIARWRADQARYAMLFLILGHIDGGEKLAATVKPFGNLHYRLGLAHTAGAHQQKSPQRTTGTPQVGACSEQVTMHPLDGHILPLDQLTEVRR